MPTPLFYLFALIMLAGATGVVALKNPVACALSMIVSFIGLAALFVGLNAYFIGILQVLVYTGAVMVLFLFIIMLLDLKKDKASEHKTSTVVTGSVLALLLVSQIIAVLATSNNLAEFAPLDPATLASAADKLPTDQVPADSQIRAELKSGSLPDVNLIGQKLFTEYNFPLQIVGFLLLVATIGCVSLSKKLKPKS